MFTKTMRANHVAAALVMATLVFGMLAVTTPAHAAGGNTASLLTQLRAQLQALQVKVQTFTTSTGTTSTPIIRNQTIGIAGTRNMMNSNDVRVGDQIVTTTNLNVRATPEYSGTQLGLEKTGSAGTVIGGPSMMVNGQITQMSYVNNNSWWQINYADGVSGWSNAAFIRNVGQAGASSTTCTNVHFSPSTINAYQQTSLYWNTANATKVTVNSDTGYVNTSSGLPLNGSVAMTPTRSGRYFVYAYRADGSHVSCAAWINVNGVGSHATATAMVASSSHPVAVQNTLTYYGGARSVVNGNNVQVGSRIVTEQNIGAKDIPDYSGTTTGSVPSGTLGTVVAGPAMMDNGQQVNMSTVTMNSWWQVNWDNGVSGWANEQFLQNAGDATNNTNVPTCSNVHFSPSNSITKGDSTTLVWNTTNATKVLINSDTGYSNYSGVPANGSITLTPGRSGNYFVYAFGNGQHATCHAWIGVN